IDKGCRGVGRLLWLKAFENVEINSSFNGSGQNPLKRLITFDVRSGVKLVKETEVTNKELTTHVSLNGFDEKYHSSTPKTIESISSALLEHCLWYFVRPEGIPKILVIDSEEIINLNNLYDSYMFESAYAETIQIKDHSFDLTHIKFRASSSRKHGVSLCAASRLVKEEAISGKIPGLHGKISDKKGEFVYSCYVASPYLDERVRAERTAFDIDEDVDGLFSSTEISLKNIREEVLCRSKEYLKKYLVDNMEAGKSRVEKFVAEKAPRYRPIISRMEKDELAIDPGISDKDLELHLHKQLADVEKSMLAQGHDIMAMFEGDLDDYQDRLNEYLRTAEDIKKSDLANYVSHRRVILDLLEKSIQRNESGSYAREDLIHELIMPMRKESNEIWSDTYNLWLIDERLAFHNYLASDKTLKSMPITGNESTKEPDICALNVCDNPILVSESQALPLASITVIEIKRPMRNDAKQGEEKDPIEQALGYLKRIRKGHVTTANGRPIPDSEDIPGYCYVICDLTSSIIERCKIFDLTISSDHMGYFGYHKHYKAYIEVISYDKLVASAKERNRSFFDKLGLPTT
ncbi:MAG: ATP-binding protein, partial [Candidatus Sedimenticola sp. (ex Thyasira tokunagai)]